MNRILSLGLLLGSWALLALPNQAERSAAEEPDANGSFVDGFLQNRVIENPQSAYPIRWSPGDVDWTCQLQGYGQSSPIVWRDQVYVTTVDGPMKDRCLVTAVNRRTGDVVWIHEEAPDVPAKSDRMISRAAPTPACDENGVYVFFETGNLLALNHAGEIRWQRQLQSQFGGFQNKFGIAASVVQTAEKLFLLIEHDEDAFLLAVHKSDGSDAWRTGRSNRGHSWTSPSLLQVEEQPLLVCSSIGSIDLYNPENGEQLARYDAVGGNSVASPIDFGDGRFLVSSLIRPADGPVEGATRSNMLVRAVKEQDGYAFDVAWTAENARGSFCSPILHGEFCYWINPVGVLFCLDAATGQQHYAKRLSCGGCWATPLAIGDRLYCFGTGGEAIVAQIGNEYEELASGNRVWVDSISGATDGSESTEKSKMLARSGHGRADKLYSVIALDDGFLFRRGDMLYHLPDARSDMNSQ